MKVISVPVQERGEAEEKGQAQSLYLVKEWNQSNDSFRLEKQLIQNFISLNCKGEWRESWVFVYCLWITHNNCTKKGVKENESGVFPSEPHYLIQEWRDKWLSFPWWSYSRLTDLPCSRVKEGEWVYCSWINRWRRIRSLSFSSSGNEVADESEREEAAFFNRSKLLSRKAAKLIHRVLIPMILKGNNRV